MISKNLNYLLLFIIVEQLKRKFCFSNNTRDLETYKANKQTITYEVFWQFFAIAHKYNTRDKVNIINLF